MSVSRRSLLRAGAALAACAALSPLARGAAAEERPSTLRIGLIPNQAPDRIRAQYRPFGEYLADTLGQSTELFVATDYAGVVEALAADKLDMAYFGGVTYAQAELRAQLYPIVTEIDRETGTTRYYSALITRVDSPIQTAADVKERKFAFGDINSTSGSLYPRIMLDRAGIGDFQNPQKFIYTGGHDATVLAVQNGSVDAGGVEKRIMQRLFDAGTADASQIRVIEQSLVQGYPWCVRSALDPELVERITLAFESIKDDELLKLMRAQSYARVGYADYDEIRQEARRVGLIR
ncbi:MAG: phosphate/phosphite/phosphonate ABC transporter substrate-binding protein [Chloroflexota bacterium]